jgi:hypothetical protein
VPRIRNPSEALSTASARAAALMDLLGLTEGELCQAAGPHRRPIDALLGRCFPRFEDALDDLGNRGFVLRAG